MIEILLHFSMTPILFFMGYLCWYLALNKKMTSIYLKYEPQYRIFCFFYRVLWGFILMGIMNIILMLYLAYSTWVYN